MEEVIGMVKTLMDMRTDTYMMCKCVFWAVSCGKPGTKVFVEELFNLTDRKRPLLIGMKKGGAA